MQEGNEGTSESAFFRAQTVGMHLLPSHVSMENARRSSRGGISLNHAKLTSSMVNWRQYRMSDPQLGHWINSPGDFGELPIVEARAH